LYGVQLRSRLVVGMKDQGVVVNALGVGDESQARLSTGEFQHLIYENKVH
jgi:hypothetical protein